MKAYIMIRYVYISGYGRSGSTLLDLYLAQAGFFSVGEAVCIEENVKSQKRCTCGEYYDECAYWRYFFENYKMLPEKYWIDLIRYAVSNRNFIVDSSKSSWKYALRPLKISRMLGDKFLVVHLFRNPYDVYYSTVYRGSNKAIEAGLSPLKRGQAFKTCVGYVLANLLYFFYKLCVKEVYLLEYDDFTTSLDCRQSLLINVDAPSQVCLDRIDVSQNSMHMIDGNRLRHSSHIHFEKNLDVKKSYLKLFDRFLIKMLMMPVYSLMRSSNKYGQKI